MMRTNLTLLVVLEGHLEGQNDLSPQESCIFIARRDTVEYPYRVIYDECSVVRDD